MFLFGIELQQVSRNAVGQALELIAGEPHARFVAQFVNAVAWCVRRFAEPAQRPPARQQQIALDQLRKPEIRVALNDFLDFRKCQVEPVIADLDQRLDQHCLGFHLGLAGARFLDRLATHRRNLTGAGSQRDGGDQPQRQANLGGAEKWHPGHQLLERSCWIIQRLPPLTIVSVLVLVTFRVGER